MQTDVVTRCFEWRASAELVPPHVYDALTKVENLLKGEHGVREGRKVRPVSRAYGNYGFQLAGSGCAAKPVVCIANYSFCNARVIGRAQPLVWKSRRRPALRPSRLWTFPALWLRQNGLSRQ